MAIDTSMLDKAKAIRDNANSAAQSALDALRNAQLLIADQVMGLQRAIADGWTEDIDHEEAVRQAAVWHFGVDYEEGLPLVSQLTSCINDFQGQWFMVATPRYKPKHPDHVPTGIPRVDTRPEFVYHVGCIGIIDGAVTIRYGDCRNIVPPKDGHSVRPQLQFGTANFGIYWDVPMQDGRYVHFCEPTFSLESGIDARVVPTGETGWRLSVGVAGNAAVRHGGAGTLGPDTELEGYSERATRVYLGDITVNAVLAPMLEGAGIDLRRSHDIASLPEILRTYQQMNLEDA